MRVEEVLKRLNINPVSFDERKALINLSTTEIQLLEAIHKPLYAYGKCEQVSHEQKMKILVI